MTFSHADFTGKLLLDADFSGVTEIRSSCFSQEWPDTEVFPKNISVVFYNCNLDNVLLPEGCQVVDCSVRRFAPQNDGNDWEIDADGNPVRFLNYKALQKMGIEPPSPEGIPSQPVAVAVNYFDSVRNVRA